MSWCEIDQENKNWNIPAERMKREKELVVPLTNRMIEILAIAKSFRTNEFMWPSSYRAKPAPISYKTFNRAKPEDYDNHGFRKSFKNWTAKMKYPRELAEFALAHAVGGSIERIYWTEQDCLEERRPMMAEWSEFCSSATVL